MNDEEKLRLALRVISGRQKYFDDDECQVLGFDSYKFSVYRKPAEDEILMKAESIIFEAIERNYERKKND